jgi:hypothetical protein
MDIVMIDLARFGMSRLQQFTGGSAVSSEVHGFFEWSICRKVWHFLNGLCVIFITVTCFSYIVILQHVNY